MLRKRQFFFSVRLKPGRLLVWNYWCHLIAIWHLRVKKWESLGVIENRRHAGSWWRCSISLVQPFLKPDPHLDPSDTWSNKSLCARILLVKFSKTCNQESKEWSAEQHDTLLGNKKPTGVLSLLSLLLKRRSTECFRKSEYISRGKLSVFPFQAHRRGYTSNNNDPFLYPLLFLTVSVRGSDSSLLHSVQGRKSPENIFIHRSPCWSGLLAEDLVETAGQNTHMWPLCVTQACS